MGEDEKTTKLVDELNRNENKFNFDRWGKENE